MCLEIVNQLFKCIKSYFLPGALIIFRTKIIKYIPLVSYREKEAKCLPRGESTHQLY